MWKKIEIYSIKKTSFGQKRPCVLHDFVPRGVFFNPMGGGSLIANQLLEQDLKNVHFRIYPFDLFTQLVNITDQSVIKNSGQGDLYMELCTFFSEILYLGVEYNRILSLCDLR